jgi:transcription elongation GreA/GreB family factor
VDIKRYFVDELKRVYQERIAGAGRAEADAALEAEEIRTASNRREDAKSADLQNRLAAGHRERREKWVDEVDALLSFAERGLPDFKPTAKIALGALVDVQIESATGEVEERTLFVLPVGAGTEVSGPGGDGFVSVVTPSSPVGRALVGARVGDSFEITIEGRERYWTVESVG